MSTMDFIHGLFIEGDSMFFFANYNHSGRVHPIDLLGTFSGRVWGMMNTSHSILKLYKGTPKVWTSKIPRHIYASYMSLFWGQQHPTKPVTSQWLPSDAAARRSASGPWRKGHKGHPSGRGQHHFPDIKQNWLLDVNIWCLCFMDGYVITGYSNTTFGCYWYG